MEDGGTADESRGCFGYYVWDGDGLGLIELERMRNLLGVQLWF
jgi:hypothetical protein